MSNDPRTEALAEEIVSLIEGDMCGRSGLDIREIVNDPGIEAEIHDAWVHIVSAALRSGAVQ